MGKWQFAFFLKDNIKAVSVFLFVGAIVFCMFFPANANANANASSALTGSSNVQITEAASSLPPLGTFHPPPTIDILADGSVTGTNSIERNGNVYSFLSNINETIVVARDNIVLDGANHTLMGDNTLFQGINLSSGSQAADNVTIENLQIQGFGEAIYSESTSNLVITRTNITDTTKSGLWGIFLSDCSNNVLTYDRITNNPNGGAVIDSENGKTVFSDNYVADNGAFGLQLQGSNFVLRNNSFVNDTESIVGLSGQGENIDTSNTIDGKPIYYWTNVEGKTVPSDAGLVVLSKCSKITVKNLNLSDNEAGVMMFYTTDSTVTGNSLDANGYGIEITNSSSITLTGNDISNNDNSGIDLNGANSVEIEHNNIANNGNDNNTGITFSANQEGIWLESADKTYIFQNNITGSAAYGAEIDSGGSNTFLENYFLNNNGGGINILSGKNFITNNMFKNNNGFAVRLSGSQNSVFYLNDFVDNNVAQNFPVSNPWYGGPETNTWDNGSMGNYWSDYFSRYANASEIDHTGIGDTPFFINPDNIDHYPLINPYPMPNFTITIPEAASSSSNLSSASTPEFPAVIIIIAILFAATAVILLYSRNKHYSEQNKG